MSFSWPCRRALPCLQGVLVVPCHVPEVPCPSRPCQHPHGPCRLPCPGDSSVGIASVVASRGAPRGLRSPCPASWALQPWSRVHSARHLFWERCPHLWPAAQPRTHGTSRLPWGQPLGHPRNPRMGLAPRCWCLPLVLVAPPCWRAARGRGGPCVTLEGHLRNGRGGEGRSWPCPCHPCPPAAPPALSIPKSSKSQAVPEHHPQDFLVMPGTVPLPPAVLPTRVSRHRSSAFAGALAVTLEMSPELNFLRCHRGGCGAVVLPRPGSIPGEGRAGNRGSAATAPGSCLPLLLLFCLPPTRSPAPGTLMHFSTHPSLSL